jgi:hypothetical protein
MRLSLIACGRGALQRLLLLTALNVAACTPNAGPPSVPAASSDTIQSIMATQIDPSADALWASVSITSTAAGTEFKQPRTAGEWDAIRVHAIKLIAASDLLGSPGHHVVLAGGQTEDASTTGIEKPADIERAIHADPAAFGRAAQVLRAAGVKMLAAIDAKNADAVTVAGGDIDEACESCHLRYWYPNTPRPK